MGLVIFWVVIVFALAVAFTAWYVYASPPRRFRPPAPGSRAGRWKAVVEWDTTHTVRDCPACGGAGALQYRDGVKYVIPREHWERSVWARANLADCPACHGLGYVGRNWRPPPRFRWPHGAPVSA